MATATIIQRFVDEAKDAIDAASEFGLTPQQSVEALNEIVEYAVARRGEHADDAVRKRHARSLLRGLHTRSGK
jgi:hypothetical protein